MTKGCFLMSWTEGVGEGEVGHLATYIQQGLSRIQSSKEEGLSQAPWEQGCLGRGDRS